MIMLRLFSPRKILVNCHSSKTQDGSCLLFNQELSIHLFRYTALLSHSSGLRMNFGTICRNRLHAPLKNVQIAEAIASVIKDEYNYVNDLAFTPDGR